MLINFLDLLFTVLIWAIFIRIILSWIWPNIENPIVQFLKDITDPILLPIKKIMPKTGMIDFSPLVAVLLLDLIRIAINNYL
ncbi:YggT family protein [Patescibacteria group bacterium]